MRGIPYMVKGRIGGLTAANVVFLSEEFIEDATEQQFRGVMKSSVAALIEEKFGVGVEFDLSWKRGDLEVFSALS